MTEESPVKNLLTAWVAPRALFAGIVLSFLACCWAGRLATRDSYLEGFRRFHQTNSLSTLYYPTASQLKQYVTHHASRRQILVIIGGSSVLQGTGQDEKSLWSTRLQEQLGDEYKVINFAMQAGRPQEVGYVVAESLVNSYKKLIFVADCAHAQLAGAPDGYLYKYFFWDAAYKGLIKPDPVRSAEIRKQAAMFPGPFLQGPLPQAGYFKERSFPETRQGEWLDSHFYFNDLWSMLGYTTVFTVWSPITANRDHFYKPRRDFPDLDEAAPPVEERYKTAFDESMEVTRNTSTRGCRKTADGDWVIDEESSIWKDMREAAATCFSPKMKEHMLFVVEDHSPYYVARLSAGERKGLEAVQNKTTQVLQEAGFATLDATQGYTSEDFADRTHKAPSGGEKLATQVAAGIRELAKKRGYIP